MNLNQGIAQLLKDEGCRIFGFADLTLLPPEFEDARRGASVAIIMGEPYGTAEGIREMFKGKSGKFGNESGATFEPLNRYKAAVKSFLKSAKYPQLPQTHLLNVVRQSQNRRVRGIALNVPIYAL